MNVTETGKRDVYRLSLSPGTILRVKGKGVRNAGYTTRVVSSRVGLVLSRQSACPVCTRPWVQFWYRKNAVVVVHAGKPALKEYGQEDEGARPPRL